MKRDQIQLFDLQLSMPSVEERTALAKSTITKLFYENVPVCVAFSGGKDSTVCADLVLTSAREYRAITGISPLVLITTSDTLVENPEITAHFRKELRKMELYGKKYGLKVLTRIATPPLLSTWQLKILTGRGLPSFAGLQTDCSWDMKIQPQAVLRKQIFKSLKDEGRPEAVTCLGTRFDESEKRSLNMLIRGENDVAPVKNTDGDLILAPICDWSTDDVFEYLGTRSTQDAFSDFTDTLRIYAHSEGQSCAVVASAIKDGLSKRKKGGCGARHGCFVCQQATDKSLENMVEFDERYAYADPLTKFNRFVRNTRHDWSRRHWVGRTIKAGYIAIEPDTYHPTMVRELFRYMVQLDYDESKRAAAAGEAPKFRIFTAEMVLAIDAYWSLNGLAQPFAAWADVIDINSGKVRYDIPEIELVPATPKPDAMFLYVGTEWDDSACSSELPGMRDPYLESLLEISACAPDLRETSAGRLIWDLDNEPSFSVDGEGLAMFMDFELDRVVQGYRDQLGWPIPGSITRGYMWYIQYGVLTLNGAQTVKHDEILRRTAHKDRLGLTLGYDIQELLERSVRFSELPQEAREAWSKKATTASAQAELLI